MPYENDELYYNPEEEKFEVPKEFKEEALSRSARKQEQNPEILYKHMQY